MDTVFFAGFILHISNLIFMKSNIPFKTKNKNNYFYNRKNKSIFLTHPISSYLLEIYEQGKDMEEEISKIEGNIHINDYGSFSKEDVIYYYNKIQFLNSVNQLDASLFEKNINIKISEKEAKEFFANGENIVFEVTQRCNLNCNYCTYGEYYNWFENRVDEDLQFIKAKRLLDYYIELAKSQYNKSFKHEVTIGFYGGEPLLNFPFIEKVVNYVKKIKSDYLDFNFLMTTNALYLKKYSDFIAKNNFQLLISLDGDKNNNEYRVYKNNKPAFQQIIDNITFLKEKYSDYFEKRVGFNAVLHNKNSVKEIYTFFQKEFNKVPMISEVTSDSIKDDMKESFLNLHKNFRESLNQVEDYSDIDMEQVVNSPNYIDLREFIQSSKQLVNYSALLYAKNSYSRITSTCAPFSFKIFMTVSGKLLPCENINHDFHLGIVTENEVKLDFEKIGNVYTNYYNKMKKQCFNCYFQENCKQCILFLDIESEYPKCNGFIPMHETYSQHISSLINMIEEKPQRYLNLINE